MARSVVRHAGNGLLAAGGGGVCALTWPNAAIGARKNVDAIRAQIKSLPRNRGVDWAVDRLFPLEGVLVGFA